MEPNHAIAAAVGTNLQHLQHEQVQRELFSQSQALSASCKPANAHLQETCQILFTMEA